MATTKSNPQSKGMLPPARTFEEFLLSQNLDDWPRFPYMPDVDVIPVVTKLKNDFSLYVISKSLHDNAPLPTEIISSLGDRVEECRLKVHGHAEHVFALESGKEEINDQQIAVPEQAVAISTCESKDTAVQMKKEQLKIAVGVTQDTSCKRVENYKFPGFKARKLTKLPNYLEPAQLWDAVLKVQAFRGVNVKVLKKLFLSEASLAILQDCFWWLYLQKFKPNQKEQDHFFDRISDSFVALLLSTPNYIKDPFFETYPDCLSQTIYVTFCEAFPESSGHFEDKFKEELMDLIFQWIRGFKPQKCAWKKWNLWWLEKPPKGSPTQDSLQRVHLTKPQRMWSDVMSKVKTLRFQFPNEEQPPKEPPKPKKESHYIGDGPDFQRSLFNLGGQSPLVSYYLKMHGISNTLANSRAYRISHTEVCRIPTPVSPTYQDVIEETTRSAGKLHNDFLKFDVQRYEVLAVLEEKREKVNRTYQRMLSKITKNPTEFRMKIEKFISDMENVKQRDTASSVANFERESGLQSLTKPA